MSIANAVDRYMKSEKGQAKIKECVEKYKKSGDKTASGIKITDTKTVYKLARELRSSIISLAKSYYESGDLPDSVMRDITKLEIGDAVEEENYFRVSFVFKADLHRDSLENEYSTWDGIDNIIALFNNGYKAEKQTFGYWDKHKRMGESGLDMRDTNTDIWVPSRTERPGLHFINDGVAEFKAEQTKNKDFKIKVKINKDYLK